MALDSRPTAWVQAKQRWSRRRYFAVALAKRGITVNAISPV
jgi:hypothetical protein